MMHRFIAVLFLATLARGNNFNQQEQIQQHSNDQGVFNALDSAFGTSGFGGPVSAFGVPTSAFGGPALGYPSFGQASALPTLGQSPTFDQRRMLFVPSSSNYGRPYAPLPVNYVANTPMVMPQPIESHLFAEPVYGSSMIGQPMLGSPGYGSSLYNSPIIGQPMYGSPTYGSSVLGSPMLSPQVSYTPPIVAESVYQPMMGSSYMEPSYVSTPYVDSTFIGSPGYQRSSMMPLGPAMMKTPVVGTAVFTQPVLMGDEENHDHHDSHK